MLDALTLETAFSRYNDNCDNNCLESDIKNDKTFDIIYNEERKILYIIIDSKTNYDTEFIINEIKNKIMEYKDMVDYIVLNHKYVINLRKDKETKISELISDLANYLTEYKKIDHLLLYLLKDKNVLRQTIAKLFAFFKHIAKIGKDIIKTIFKLLAKAGRAIKDTILNIIRSFIKFESIRLEQNINQPCDPTNLFFIKIDFTDIDPDNKPQLLFNILKNKASKGYMYAKVFNQNSKKEEYRTITLEETPYGYVGSVYLCDNDQVKDILVNEFFDFVDLDYELKIDKDNRSITIKIKGLAEDYIDKILSILLYVSIGILIFFYIAPSLYIPLLSTVFGVVFGIIQSLAATYVIAYGLYKLIREYKIFNRVRTFMPKVQGNPDVDLKMLEEKLKNDLNRNRGRKRSNNKRGRTNNNNRKRRR